MSAGPQSGEVVNLRMARKRRSRADDAAKADANRGLHSISAAERHRVRETERQAKSRHEAHRRADDNPGA